MTRFFFDVWCNFNTESSILDLQKRLDGFILCVPQNCIENSIPSSMQHFDANSVNEKFYFTVFSSTEFKEKCGSERHTVYVAVTFTNVGNVITKQFSLDWLSKAYVSSKLYFKFYIIIYYSIFYVLSIFYKQTVFYELF